MSGVLRAPRSADVGLAMGLALVSVAELFTDYAFEFTPEAGPTPVHVVVAAAVGAAIAWRRQYPLIVAPLVCALLAIQPLVVPRPNVYGEIIALVIALYGVTAFGPTWRSTALSGLASLALVGLLGLSDPEDPVGGAVTSVMLGGVVLVAGGAVRRQRNHADKMRAQRDSAHERAREVAAVERARIARELHDIVAHGMSVVVLQARGGRRMLDDQPETARSAFADIERVATECLDEMRRLLGILRYSDADTAPLEPQPRLAELNSLVEQARASGAAVEFMVEGERRSLPPAIELSAFRVAQEALTNSIKHAPGSTTRLRLIYTPDALGVYVSDDGPGPQETSQGHGLIGMRERVELFGGRFTAGPEAGGGFAVHARFPLAQATQVTPP